MTQPIHVVYGGAHLFKPDTAAKLSRLALQTLTQQVPDDAFFAEAFGFKDIALARRVRERVLKKLQSGHAIQDYRIDFEDGYGPRPENEEDSHARSAAESVAEGMRAGSLPQSIGIRIKALTPALSKRASRTLELFFSALYASGGSLPENFRVTLPKVTSSAQVAKLEKLLSGIEKRRKWKRGAIRIELMVETPQALFGPRGEAALPAFVRAAKGRCVGAHFGAYDYLSLCDVSASDQGLGHPGCDFARQVMQATLAGSGVALCDGATTRFPVGSREDIFAAWKLSCANIRRSLSQGFHQGWDLHPAQLPARYAAVYGYFLADWEAATARLTRFLGEAAKARLQGSVFDDAATGQGLLNHVLRAHSSGAVTDEEVARTGLLLDELKTRSFGEILEKRQNQVSGAV